jgi:uncharacterized protein with HEPN domain
MPSRSAVNALRDILTHIDLAAAMVVGFDEIAFKDDIRTVYAVTRCLEIISEASRSLPADMKERHPTMPWRQIAGAGNIYRHDYEDVAARFVWEAVAHDLAPLRSVVAEELARDGGEPGAQPR